jgi:hypothetical protein
VERLILARNGVLRPERRRPDATSMRGDRSENSEESCSAWAGTTSAGSMPGSTDIQDVISIVANIGIRPVELCNLRWSDVEFERRRLSIGALGAARARRVEYRRLSVQNSNFGVYLVRLPAPKHCPDINLAPSRFSVSVVVQRS